MKKSILGLSVALMLSACSASKDGNQPLESWQNFDETPIEMIPSGNNQAVVVFYRKNDVKGAAVNLYINNHYQASLLPNAFTSVSLCTDQQLFSASYSSNSQFGNRYAGIRYNLPTHRITYIRVGQTADQQLTFTQEEPIVAEQEIAVLLKENQTLSRVPAPQDCRNTVIAMESLDTNALFELGQFAYTHILPAGRQEIALFAEKVKRLPNASGIVITGHTDPIGSDQYNQTLSQRRAETVKQILIQNGVTLPIKAVGYGKQDLLIKNCRVLQGEAQVKCNQPNRRVEITVFGDKQ